MKSKTAANSTFAIGGVLSSEDSLVQAESFVLRINIGGKNPAHRKSAKRYPILLQRYNRPRLIKAIRISEARVKVYTSLKTNE